MHFVEIPYYGYWGTINRQMKAQFVVSDEIYNAYKDLSERVLYHEEDLMGIDAPKRVNGYFHLQGLLKSNEDILNGKFAFYCLRKPSDPSDYPFHAMVNMMNLCYLPVTEIPESSGTDRNVCLNDTRIYNNEALGNIDVNSGGIAWRYSGRTGFGNGFSIDDNGANITLIIFPSSCFAGDTFVLPPDSKWVTIKIYFTYNWDNENGNVTNISEYTIRLNKTPWDYNFMQVFRDFTFVGSATNEEDFENPYSNGWEGNSGTGGGNGKYGNPDEVDPVDIPDLPDISAADLGFVTIYNPTRSQLKSLADFMWSNLFDLNTYKKLFSDPMESIIGLSIVPVAPSIGGSKHVMFGTIDSGVSMSYLSTQYVQKNCGWIDIDEYIGCFLDSAPYTKVSLFLPFIGIHELSADDVVGGSINVVYNIDVLSGACSAFVKHSSRGVLYSYNGSCISNIPLTAVNFSGAIQNAVSAVCSGTAMLAGMATGAAPVTAMGAASMLTSAANTALNSKPSIQRSGSLGGSAGIMSVLTPYVIIERPDVSVPAMANKMVGLTSNITYKLESVHGFTMVDYIHISNCNGTAEEVAEIESLLKQGVYL